MISVRRRWAVAALVVGLGWLVTPQPVAVYDGIGVPDEPYRYVVRPPDKKPTAGATTAVAQTPVKNGVGTSGLSVATAEQSPQFLLFMPPGAMAAPGGTIEVKAVPQAPTDKPKGAVIDGNVYLVSLSDVAGAVTLTYKAAIATLYLRATDTKNGRVMSYRPQQADAWKALQTSQNGTDSFVSSFVGPGQYALALSTLQTSSRTHTSSGTHASSGTHVLPFVLAGGIVLLVVVVVVVRLRAPPE